MGNIYFFGQGIPKDYAKAHAMFEASAQQGYFAAFAPTAQMYVQGLGVPADPSKAYYWHNIAAAQLPDSSERTEMMDRRESVAASLTRRRSKRRKTRQSSSPSPSSRPIPKTWIGCRSRRAPPPTSRHSVTPALPGSLRSTVDHRPRARLNRSCGGRMDPAQGR